MARQRWRGTFASAKPLARSVSLRLVFAYVSLSVCVSLSLSVSCRACREHRLCRTLGLVVTTAGLQPADPGSIPGGCNLSLLFGSRSRATSIDSRPWSLLGIARDVKSRSGKATVARDPCLCQAARSLCLFAFVWLCIAVSLSLSLFLVAPAGNIACIALFV